MTKDEMLTNLYTIRAGLSQISKHKDRAELIARRIDKAGQRKLKLQQVAITSSNKDENIERLIRMQQQELDELNAKYPDNLSNFKIDDSEINRRYKKGNIFFSLLLGFCVTAILIVIMTMMHDYMIIPDYERSLAIFGAIGLIVLSIIKLCKRKRSRNRELEEAKRARANQNYKIREKKRKLQENIYKNEDKLIKNKGMNEKHNQELTAVEENYQNCLLECMPIFVAETENAELLYRALDHQLGDFLDCRDWSNVDLLIFYFETGRADSIKDGLLLVDQQRQNDRLVKAIRAASIQISGAVAYGMERLGTMMTQSFSALSSQVGKLSHQMQEQGDRMAKGIDNLITVQTASAQQLKVALEEKANTSSDRLADDVRYLRNLAQEYRNANSPYSR